MPINKDLQDSAIRHQILMTRVSTGVTHDMLTLLNKSEARLFATMRALDPDDVATRFKRARIHKMIATIQDQQDQLRRVFKSQLKGNTDEISINEIRFTKKQLTEAAGASFTRGFDFVSPERVQAAATERPFRSAQLPWATQGEHVDELFRRRMAQVESEILSGFVEGQSTDQIVRNIRGTAPSFRDGIMEISRRGAETLTRTAVNHTANATRQILFEQNEDLIAGVRYVAILDGRTTQICMSLDGNIYPIKSGPRPPQHPNCRSTTVEVLKDEIGSITKGRRGTLNVKNAPEYNSYNDWLKTQPRTFVEEVLGKTKAQLYLDGKLTLDRFVDAKGATLTLDQLRRKENEAWKAAGLDKTGTPPRPKPKPKPKASTPPPVPKATAPATTLSAAQAASANMGITLVEPGTKVFEGFSMTTKNLKQRLRVLNQVNAEAQRMLDKAAKLGRNHVPLYQNMHFVPNLANSGLAHIGERNPVLGSARKNTLMQVAGAWETEKSNAKAGMRSYGVRNDTKRRWIAWDGEENLNRVTFRHELGHILTYFGSTNKLRRILKDLKWGERITVKDKISVYAGTNIKETAAELFSMVHAPSYVRGTLPIELEDFADEMLVKG